MENHLSQIEALDEIGEILDFAGSVCRDHGVIRESYHLTPLSESPNSSQTMVFADGFDPEWLEIYEREDFRRIDPIPRRTLDRGTLLTWQEARKAEPNSPENLEFFEAMEKFGLLSGFGLPLYGPGMHNSCASFDFGYPISEVDDAQLAVVRGVAQAAHQRISFVLRGEPPIVDFSKREQEVLEWLAAGKSMNSIATIMGISHATVKTYTGRIYKKLDVSDRISAVIKALKLGLIYV